MKLIGHTKKEIKDIKKKKKKGEIRSNIDLKEIFSEKRYSEIERSIEFEGEKKKKRLTNEQKFDKH